VAELRPGYEEVFTVIDYFDGPLKGVANFRRQPHFYDRVFDESQDEYSNLYQLTPISRHVFDLAKEDWVIWKRWESSFHAGKTTLKSHPALPQDRVRHKDIRAVLDSALKTDKETCIIQAGLFEALASQTLPNGVRRPLQVRWTDPKLDR